MIFLFNRVYLQHDNRPNACNGQERYFITGREYRIPFASDENNMRAAGIRANFKSLAESDAANGDRDGFWAAMRSSEAKTLIVADRRTVATLLIQYWKSIFKETTPDSLFTLYGVVVNSENGHSACDQYRTNIADLLGLTDRFVNALSRAEFMKLYREVPATTMLEGLEPANLPFEYLFLSYFGKTHTEPVKTALFQKIDLIMRENFATEVATLKTELFQRTNNFYLLTEQEGEEIILDPIAYMRSKPMLAWALDEEIYHGNEAEILRRYTLEELRDFMKVHHKLIDRNDDDFEIIDHIVTGDYEKIIEVDVERHKSNYFSTGAFQTKLNGIMVCYAYHLRRLDLLERLKIYELK